MLRIWLEQRKKIKEYEQRKKNDEKNEICLFFIF